mmetsp:Transcript_22428/g.48973  ORF Transcript_22428/g.48973 Transcript_22428/m.48973 type:complete len:330 (+) Transcript_22428:22-1011(+)|eukprot:1425846-Pleurochrysis_carterae.AAC.4
MQAMGGATMAASVAMLLVGCEAAMLRSQLISQPAHVRCNTCRLEHSFRSRRAEAFRPTLRSRLAGPIRAQQGPLEDGYKELLPFVQSTEEGNIDPELVARIDAEVLQLTGVPLDDLLNPSKVVNLERDRILCLAELAKSLPEAERVELQAKLDKVEQDLYREKRTVFRGWLKAVFIVQSLIAIVASGIFVYDAVPGVSLDLSLRALGFWSYWLFVIPSLRARRSRGWEKKALNIAFLGSPILTLGLPFVTKDPAAIWGANLVLLVGCYAYGYLSYSEEQEVGGFSGVLRWLDFGSGQERGMRASQREALRNNDAKDAAGQPDREEQKVK